MPDHAVPHPDLGGYVLGTLEPAEADAFRSHLARCEHCRAEAAELGGLPSLLALAAPPLPEPPDILRVRTRDAVRSRMRTDRVRRRMIPAAAVAAAIALVVGASLWLTREPSTPTFSVELTPVASSSGVEAVASLQRTGTGIRVELALDGLEPAPPGGHYECWYVGAHDSPATPDRISAGTFTVPGPGKFTVEMITAADPTHFTSIVVTLERDSGDPTPGDAVLVSEKWQPRQA